VSIQQRENTNSYKITTEEQHIDDQLYTSYIIGQTANQKKNSSPQLTHSYTHTSNITTSGKAKENKSPAKCLSAKHKRASNGIL
jgi:hypothetical protein